MTEHAPHGDTRTAVVPRKFAPATCEVCEQAVPDTVYWPDFGPVCVGCCNDMWAVAHEDDPPRCPWRDDQLKEAQMLSNRTPIASRTEQLWHGGNTYEVGYYTDGTVRLAYIDGVNGETDDVFLPREVAAIVTEKLCHAGVGGPRHPWHPITRESFWLTVALWADPRSMGRGTPLWLRPIYERIGRIANDRS